MLPLARRPTERRTLHYDFSQLAPHQDYTLHVCMEAFPLRAHTAASRDRARDEHAFLRHVPDTNLTHYAENQLLPSDAVALMQVTRPDTVDGHVAEHTVHLAIHVPQAGRHAARLHARQHLLKSGGHVHLKLQRLGLTAAQLGDVDPVFPPGIDSWQDAVDAASAVMFQHPSLVNLSTDKGGAIPAYILEVCIQTAINRAPDLPSTILSAGDGWMKTIRALGPDGQPLSDSDGNPVFGRRLNVNVQRALTGALAIAIRLSRDDDFLKGQTWNVQYGVTSAPYNGQARDSTSLEHVAEPHPSASLLRTPALADDGYRWGLRNLSPGRGLSIDSQVSYQRPVGSSWLATGIWSDQDGAAGKLDADAAEFSSKVPLPVAFVRRSAVRVW
jgi:hypothetical protein